MCLIKNNKCIVKCTTSHICKRCNLDKTFFHIGIKALCTHNLEKCIIQRSEIRINLALQISRQESKLFTCLNRRSCKNNLIDLIILKCINSHRHCKICLTCSCRSYSEHNHLIPNGINILLLSECLRLDRPSCNRPAHCIRINLNQRISLFFK